MLLKSILLSVTPLFIVYGICASDIPQFGYNESNETTEILAENVEDLFPEVFSSENQDGGTNETFLESEFIFGESDYNGSEIKRVQKSVVYDNAETVELFRNVHPSVAMTLEVNRSDEDALVLRRNIYGSEIVEDPLYYEVMKSVPKPEQRSLVIVFDGTVSMLNDLEQLETEAEVIIKEVTQRENNPIFNYIFVPFRDPYVGPKLVTQNITKFLEAIRNLSILGGGDCPEATLAAINLALESALPKSFVYVFTDAIAKDFSLESNAIDLIQEKQASITFLLTGFCKSKSSEGYKTFERLASISNGQVYNLQKTDVGEVLAGIRASLDADLVPINYLYSNTSGSQSLDVPVDQNLREFTVSVAGEKPNITVKNPDNEEHKNVSEVLVLNNLKVLNVQDPQPGLWNVETKVDSEHSIKVTGISDLKFSFGFSENEPKDISDTYINPESLRPNILSVTPSDDSLIHNLTSVELEVQNIKTIVLPLHKSSEKTPENARIFSTNAFHPPINMFKLFVNGFDAAGNPLRHVLSTFLKAVPAEIPRIIALKSFVEIVEGDDASLDCKVIFSQEGKVLWERNNTILEESEHRDHSIHHYNIKNAQLEDAGEYICSIHNSEMSDMKRIHLIVHKKITPVSVKIIDSNMTATENDVDYQISCFARPNTNVKFSWLFKGEPISSDNADVMTDKGNLILNTVNRTNAGDYTCIADNGDVVANDTGYLTVFYAPSIIGPDAENITVFYGDDVQLNCSADGIPIPQIKWTTEEESNRNFENGFIQEFNTEHEGVYRCVISNGIGDVIEKLFYVEEPPAILPGTPSKLVKVGSDFEVSCECELCDPVTTSYWQITTDEGNISQVEGDLSISRADYSKRTYFNLTISNSTIEDGGIYTCHMENGFGFDERPIFIEMYEPPHVNEIFGIYRNETILNSLDVLEGDSFTLDCEFTGYPSPTLEWVKLGLDFSEHKIRNRNKTSIEVSNVTVDDRGLYQCIARNKYGYSDSTISVQVVARPKFKSPEDTVVMVENGQEVALYCDVEGDPLPRISWIVNTSKSLNDVIAPDTNEFLNFTASPEHVGVYECVAENEAGQTKKKIVLVVSFEPKIYPSEDEVINTRIGENVTLICRTDGHPKPQIWWRFNGFLLHNSSKTVIEDSGDLILRDVNTNATGSYTCEASNVMGTAQRTISLDVFYPPKILSKFPPTFKLLPHYLLSFECKAEGSPNPLIYWTRNGTIISKDESKSHILKMPPHEETHAGLYSCVAANSEGSDEVRIEIFSVEKPYVIKELARPGQLNVSEGDAIKLICPLGDVEEFSWYLDDELLEGEHLQELYIEDASGEDAGEYICLGKNEAGTQNYTKIVVVWSSPDIDSSENIDNEKEVITVQLGDNLSLQCSANGYPRPQIVWEKDSVVISTQPTLDLQNVQFYHGGDYICKASNPFGSDSVSYKIEILTPPSSALPKTNWKEIFEGDDMQIDCEPSGNPTPEISWTKDGNGLDEHEKILEIFGAQKEDRGIYVCSLQNSLGTTDIVFNVDVLSAPRFVTPPQDIAVSKNDPLELYCSAEGNPTPVLAWGYNSKTILSSAFALLNHSDNRPNEEILVDNKGNIIDEWSPISWYNTLQRNGIYGKIRRQNETVSFTLIIDDTSFKKSGTYICYAINAVGSEEQMFQVEVQEPPHLTGRDTDQQRFVNKTLIEGLPLILNCMWSGNPRPDILWYQYDKLLNERPGYYLSRNNRTLTIPQAKVVDIGLYSCVATNAAGEDRRQFFVDILAPPKITDYTDNEMIPHMHVTGSKTILECVAVGNPKPNIFWSRNLPEDPESIEILPESSSQLILDEVEQSGVYSCYVNNSLGFAEKQFSVEVLKIPNILDVWPIHQTIKEFQTLALHCRATGSPRPVIRWYKDGIEINGRFPNVHFSEDKTIMKIPNARKKDSGVYICIANNMAGEINRHTNITVKRAAIWSDWDPWTSCSSSCGKGVKTRKRRCIVNGLIAKDDNSCTGSNFESERCEMLPCPIDGGWSSWTEWTTCSRPCRDINDKESPTRKRYRNCDSPSPAFGGKHCLGNSYEEEDCNTHYCPLNGGWSEWSRWSPCSVSCGVGKKERTRECRNPRPLYGGSNCLGNNREVVTCISIPCPVDGGWSSWSDWSECSQTCGNSLKKRTRTCLNPGGRDCIGPNVEFSKCSTKPCPYLENLTIIKKPPTPQNAYDFSGLYFSGLSEENQHIEANTERYQFAKGAEETIFRKNLDPIDYYDELEEPQKETKSKDDEFGELQEGVKVIVTYQNYRPIDPDMKQITFYPDKNPYKVEKIIPCQIGFEANSKGECVDVNECERDGYCSRDQICKNTVGSYTCTCRNGFEFDDQTRKCEDIDECSSKSKNDCSHGCRNSYGSYFCTCPLSYILSSNKKTCKPKSSKLVNLMMSDSVPNPDEYSLVECPEGYERSGLVCKDIDECTTMDHDCGIEQTCLNTRGSYLCVPTPCPDDFERDELNGNCAKICKINEDTQESNCKDDATKAETIEYRLISLDKFVSSEPLLKLVNYDINRKSLPETLFHIELGKDSKLFKLETLIFKKGMAYLYAVNKIKREKLYNVKVKAVSFNPKTAEVLYVTKFVIFVYVL